MTKTIEQKPEIFEIWETKEGYKLIRNDLIAYPKEAMEGLRTAARRAYYALPLESKAKQALKQALEQAGEKV